MDMIMLAVQMIQLSGTDTTHLVDNVWAVMSVRNMRGRLSEPLCDGTIRPFVCQSQLVPCRDKWK